MLNQWSITSLALALVSCTGWEEVDFHAWEGTITVHADASVKICPDLLFYSVAPLQTSVGAKLSLRVAASSSGPMTIKWSGTGGRIEDPSALETNYVCMAPGPQRITISVSGYECERIQRIEVMCVGPKLRH